VGRRAQAETAQGSEWMHATMHAIAGRANGFTLHLVNTCVQSNLAKAFVTDKHESLNRIRQVAENWTPI